MTDADGLRAERVGWLRALVADYRRLHGVYHQRTAEDDPAATREMLAACEALAAELEAALPARPPAGGIDWTGVPL